MDKKRALNEMARKNTDKMVNALNVGKRVRGPRDTVDKEGEDWVHRHHGSAIAKRTPDGSVYVSHAGRPSMSTKERTTAHARAHGKSGFHHKKHVLYGPDNEEVDSKAWVKIKEDKMDPVREGIKNILEGNLEKMRQNFNQALAQKAVEKLEEKKLEIASSYFGNE